MKLIKYEEELKTYKRQLTFKVIFKNGEEKTGMLDSEDKIIQHSQWFGDKYINQTIVQRTDCYFHMNKEFITFNTYKSQLAFKLDEVSSYSYEITETLKDTLKVVNIKGI